MISTMPRPSGCTIHIEPGTTVMVRSLEEILATLDTAGELDRLPFMPEMARFCGQRFRVFRRADKSCVEGVGIRRMERTVFLEGLRCDGAFHDGCQRGCLYLWKEAWLQPIDGAATTVSPAPPDATLLGRLNHSTCRDSKYYCQSTEMNDATAPLEGSTIRHLFSDAFHGYTTWSWAARAFFQLANNKIRRRLGYAPMNQPAGKQVKPPKGDLDLQAGEWVEVLSRDEIMATLDADGKNRGLAFETGMLAHCGRRYRVAYPVRKIILEETGKMVALTNTVVLEGVACEGLCGRFCPRANYFYWRECWLRRCA